MSINVHVTGNPISIKRGKMVTSQDYTKSEFEKRRLMRLEQVRQQSRDIAEDVRNKVRKEKKKQMKQIEKEGKDKLKNWQNRKLLELQTQYESAIGEIGSGHRQAEALQVESEEITAKHEINQQISNQRGRVATMKLQKEQTEKSASKNVPLQRKKLVRDVENVRSAMITKFPKSKPYDGEPKIKKKKRKPSADINITISDSDSESSTDSPSNIQCSYKEGSSSHCDCTDESETTVNSSHSNNSALVYQQEPFEKQQVPPLHGLSALYENGSREIPDKFDQKKPVQAKNGQSSYKLPPQINLSPTRDTRISDRIKQREIMSSQLENFMKVAETHPVPHIESNTKITQAIESRISKKLCPNMIDKNVSSVCSCIQPTISNLQADERLNISPDPVCICAANKKSCHPMCGKMPAEKENQNTQTTHGDSDVFISKRTQINGNISSKFNNSSKTSINNPAHFDNIHSKPPDPAQFDDIPSKPLVKLKSSASITDNFSQATKTTETNAVQFYDHPNRFSHSKKVPSYVERIPTESLEVIPDIISEKEWLEKIKQRDKEAQLRGKIALDKEKVRRDYEEMMKKLPLLQKKERISEIYNDKPEYHMSEERLKERERIKQNYLENAFNKRFPDLKPALVTIPRKTHSKGNIESTEEASGHSLNVGKWDVDFEEPKMFTAQEVQEIVRAFTGHETKDRREKLKELLRSLKLQKEELLREIRALPENESVNELINDLKSFSDNDEKVVTKFRKKRRDKSERKRSRERTDKDTSGDSSQDHGERDKYRPSRHSEQASKSSPRKKAKIKSKRKVLILQNISTQTTPKSNKKQAESSTQLPKKICEKLHVPCDCDKENKKQFSEELCQILIKLNDDENPDIIVRSKEVQPKNVESKSVGIGTEELLKISETASIIGNRRGEDRSKPKSLHGTKPKIRTWKDQLSKNSLSTTSTSYMSPPDLQKTRGSQKSLYNLRGKPQQKELSSAFTYYSQESLQERPSDSKLLAHVEKLLGMARGSVENLSVSSSNVQTPTQSIIEMESNNPNANIFDALKAFSSRIGVIPEGLSYSPDFTPVPYNTTASVSELDTPREESESRSTSKEMIPEKDSSTSNKSKESVLAQYTDITDSCSKRIQTLADMIQKLREEKIQMLQLSPKPESPILSDKDFSTAYMDLPDSKESSKNSGNSLDEDEIFRRLMEIDLSLAKKLGQFTIGEKAGEAKRKTEATGAGSHTSLNSTNQEIITRLKQLKQQEEQKIPTETVTTPKSPEIIDQPFVPFLSDIPKLPKFEAQPNNVQTNHKRPPPSKGLTVVKKFNENITLIPHELSTIVEAESQLSTKMGSNAPSPNASKLSLNVSPLKDMELIVLPKRRELPGSKSSSIDKDTGNKMCNDQTCSEKTQSTLNDSKKTSSQREDKSSEMEYDITKISSNTTESRSGNHCDDSSCGKKSLKKTTSSSSDEMDTIEAMLKSIGMEWAIPTLHKTQEALALTSSSSSLDMTAKRKALGNEGSGSEVSLKQYLSKQLLSKVSSSTMKSDTSPGSLLGEFSDLSAIQRSNSSIERDKQRTSTPVTTSKSTSKSKGIFSGDSDISSVRNESSRHSNKN